VSDAPVTQQELTGNTVTGPLFSLRAYARHRQVSATAVHRAIESGRLSTCVVRDASGKFRGITDFALADREWAATTDLAKAPTAVIERAEEPSAPATPPAGTPSGEADPLEQQQLGAAAAGGDVDPDRLSPLMRQKYWQAKTAELEYKKRIGELVDAKEVEARMTDEYSRCRTKLLGLPRKAKAEMPELTHVQVLKIDNLVREALDGLAGAALVEPQS
jgi:hypothetical protein